MIFSQLHIGGEQTCIVEQVAQNQADDTGDGGGAQEVCNGLPADGADLLHVIHGNDALDHGQQNNGNNDELQQVDKDGAEGLQVVGGKVAAAGNCGADQAKCDTSNQGNDDLHRQIQFLFHLEITSKILSLLIPLHKESAKNSGFIITAKLKK